MGDDNITPDGLETHNESSPNTLPDNPHVTDTRSDVTMSSPVIKSRKTNSYSVSSIIGETSESNVDVNKESSNSYRLDASESQSENTVSTLSDSYNKNNDINQKHTDDDDKRSPQSLEHSKSREDSDNQDLKQHTEIQPMVSKHSQQASEIADEQQSEIKETELNLEQSTSNVEDANVSVQKPHDEIEDGKDIGEKNSNESKSASNDFVNEQDAIHHEQRLVSNQNDHENKSDNNQTIQEQSNNR